MSDKDERAWEWWASSDEENYTVGPCDTKEQCIAQALSEDLGYDYDRSDKAVLTFYVTEARKGDPRLSKMFDGNAWLERLSEYELEEEYNEWNDKGPVDHIDGNVITEVVQSALREWEDREGIRMRMYWFRETRNGEWITREFEKESTS